MTYSDNLEKLRQAGVIDMTKSFGVCVLVRGEKTVFVGKERYGIHDLAFWYPINVPIPQYIIIEYEKGDKILGHPLSYGRSCRWIEQRDNTHDNITDSFALSKKRHNKDLPLDDQENKEEIAEFLVSLIK